MKNLLRKLSPLHPCDFLSEFASRCTSSPWETSSPSTCASIQKVCPVPQTFKIPFQQYTHNSLTYYPITTWILTSSEVWTGLLKRNSADAVWTNPFMRPLHYKKLQYRWNVWTKSTERNSWKANSRSVSREILPPFMRPGSSLTCSEEHVYIFPLRGVSISVWTDCCAVLLKLNQLQSKTVIFFLVPCVYGTFLSRKKELRPWISENRALMSYFHSLNKKSCYVLHTVFSKLTLKMNKIMFWYDIIFPNAFSHHYRYSRTWNIRAEHRIFNITCIQ